MIKRQFGFSIAEFSSLAKLDKSEVLSADLTIVRGMVKGGIYHPDKAVWVGNISDYDQDNLDLFIRSKSERKNLSKNTQYFLDQGYQIKTIPLTESLFLEFKDLYQQTTAKKARVLKFDLELSTLALIKIKKPVFIVGLFKKNQLQSGLIFSIRDKKASVSFGAKAKFQNLRGGVGGVLEWELLKFCQAQGISDIIHGRASNPVGIFSSAGVFEFKSRYGFTAYPDGYWQTIFMRNPDIALSDLVFVSLVDNEIAYIVVTDQAKKGVEKKYLTKEVKKLKVISKKDIKKQFDDFFSTLQ